MLPIEGPEGQAQGRLERIYPLIENGRVVADVAVEGISDRFVDARVLVRLPLDTRDALAVPATASSPAPGWISWPPSDRTACRCAPSSPARGTASTGSRWWKSSPASPPAT